VQNKRIRWGGHNRTGAGGKIWKTCKLKTVPAETKAKFKNRACKKTKVNWSPARGKKKGIKRVGGLGHHRDMMTLTGGIGENGETLLRVKQEKNTR